MKRRTGDSVVNTFSFTPLIGMTMLVTTLVQNELFQQLLDELASFFIKIFMFPR